MSEQEKAAMEWLGRQIACAPVCTSDMAIAAQAARTLKDLLARPVMPEEADLYFVRATFKDWPLVIEEIRQYHRALYAHLTKPQTKEVEVWHVEHSAMRNGRWVPFVNACSTESGAELRASEFRNSPLGGNIEPNGYRCIRVTGPHKQEVPS